METVLNITRRCNLDCRYCRVRKCGVVMSRDVAETAVDMTFKHGRRHVIEFYGGEPLLEFGLMRHVVEYSENRLPEGHELSFGVTVNGTLLDASKVDYLLEHGFTVAVSYDGVTQDSQRPALDGSPSSDVVRRNLAYILGRDPATPVMTTVTREGCERLAETVDDLVSLGVRWVSLNPDAHERNWDLEEFKKSFRDAVSAARRNGVILGQMDSVANAERHGGTPLCLAGYGIIVVDTDGTVYPCTAFLDSRVHAIGDVFKGVDGDRLRTTCADADVLPGRCVGCDYRRYCRTDCLCRRFLSSGCTDDFSDMYCGMVRAIVDTYRDEYGRKQRDWRALSDRPSGFH